MHPATPAPKHDPYAALRNGSYVAYSVGWIAAVIGQQMASVALGWDIYQRTQNPMSLGWIGLVQAIPVIALALPAGMIADKFDRRRVVIFTQLLVSACGVGLAIVSGRFGTAGLLENLQGALAHVGVHLPVLKIELGLMYAIICLGAIAAAIGGPARSALVPQIIPPQVLANAYTWNASFFQIAAVVGPAAGGFLLHFSIPAVYLVDASMALIFSINLLLFIRVRAVERASGGTGLRTLTEGIRWVWQHQIILSTITLDLFAVLLGGAVYLLPVYAKLLNVGELGFGWLRAAPAIGAFVMAILVAHLPPMKNAGRAMLWAVAGFGVATIVFGLTPVGHRWMPTGKFLGGTLWYWIALIALLMTGAFDNISVVVRHTLVQVLAPDSMRGRISAVNNVFIGASNELGGFESGLTARLFGPIVSVVGGGIGTIVVVLATAGIWPQLRRFGALHEAKALEPKEPQGFEPVVKQQPT